ncbi:hypothetical protein BASA83_005321 [Batrachochytrium salamandrivorans]|nr:hypothetical protein BASA83_005321 [Batrachochytrium salamandrivorans]
MKHLPPVSVATRILLGLGGAVCKAWLDHCTAFQVHNRHHLLSALQRGNQPLISVCNHSATLDDPILFGALPWSTLFDPYQMRWSLAAKEICFTNAFTSWVFETGQALPIVRGDGIYQPVMNQAVDLLNDNRWVHIFPEGRVNQSRNMLRFKWGVARLIMDAKTPPLLLPFYHRGMEAMVPLSQHYPTPMTKVVLAFGKPIDFREYTFQPSLSDSEQRIRITQDIQSEMGRLERFVNDAFS